MPKIVFAHALISPAGESLAQIVFDVWVSFQGTTGGICDGVTRDVVGGGSQASCNKNDVAACQGGLQHAAQPRLVIADGGLIVQIDPYLPELLGNPGGVRINDVTE